MNNSYSAQLGQVLTGYKPQTQDPENFRKKNFRDKFGEEPRKQRTIFFLGLGCEGLPNILEDCWNRDLDLIPLKNRGVETQAQQLIDSGVFPTNGVVVAHSAGCNVATCYVSIVNQMVQDGRLHENCRVGRLILIAPPPPPGRLLPLYVIKHMFEHEEYWKKGFPWAKPFRLSHLYNELFMLGDDISKYERDKFEAIASPWFPRVIAANFTKPANLAWRLRGPIEETIRDQGVEVVVYGGQRDLMIKPWVAEKVARLFHGEYIHWDCSHIGFFLGYNHRDFLRELLAVISGKISYRDNQTRCGNARASATLAS